MPYRRFRWKNRQIREQIEVVSGRKSPTILLKDATYLNSVLKQWITAHIWLYEDRIVYVGDELPQQTDGTEIVDCSGRFIVPGYIEPHAHPFQLYNPQTLAQYAARRGTTTFVNDNLVLALQLEESKAFTFVDDFNQLPVSVYWWSRFDSQTELQEEEHVFSNARVKAWLEHECVLQGGELTSWPKILNGDDMVLHWMQETKRLRKQIEGHFPGASEKTLTKMRVLGADSDHEAMTGEEVMRRLKLGYTTPLRYSSIRPDLPDIIDQLNELGIRHFEKCLFTTDGSTPSFYEQGVIDRMIQIAIDKGIPLEEAYLMASYYPARHYQIDHVHGMIAPGQIAHLNILQAKDIALPVSVLAGGEWVLKDRIPQHFLQEVEWEKYGFGPMELDWELSDADLHFSMPLGMEMVNSVIMKPYSVTLDASVDELPEDADESFLMLIDRNGQWRVNTIIKGFAQNVSGFASSYSSTGDLIIIGKNKADMMAAFKRMRELGGGMVLVEDGAALYEIPLPLMGIMSDQPLEQLIQDQKNLTSLLADRGYPFSDPVYTCLFLSSTHLPYIRITPQGIYDVMKNIVLFPSIMR